jgi:hypothetical protein
MLVARLRWICRCDVTGSIYSFLFDGRSFAWVLFFSSFLILAVYIFGLGWLKGATRVGILSTHILTHRGVWQREVVAVG